MFTRKVKLIIISIIFFLALGLIFVWQQARHTIEIDNQSVDNTAGIDTDKISPLNGLACQNYQRRPIAIVLASDPVTRPLSGLSQADLVIEMPVITGSITRMMAFYVCKFPEEIGSLRSARHDFIPLAIGFDAILAHWGGSHFILDELDAGIMDNIDALKNPYNAFYQKNIMPQPHNGFTSIQRLVNSAQKLGYRLENKFDGYQHIKETINPEQTSRILKIGYSYPYNISYQYDPISNSYLRYRANLKEIDRSNNQQIKAKNIVVMRVFSRQIEGPYYNDLDLEGSGECEVYQNGQVIPCFWQKSEKNPESKLKFLDKDTNKEIPFVIGQTWIEIVEPNQEVTWE